MAVPLLRIESCWPYRWEVMELHVDHLTKRGTPPKNLDRKGDRAFRPRRRPRSSSNQLHIKICGVYRAPWAPPNYPECVFLLLECIAGEREWSKERYNQVPLFGMLARGHTPPSLPSLGSPPFWYDFTPFWHVADWGAPDWLKKVADGQLFHLVVVVQRKDYAPRRNDQRPRPAQT